MVSDGAGIGAPLHGRPGEFRRALSEPGAQSMQAAPAATSKTPKVAIDDLLPAERDASRPAGECRP